MCAETPPRATGTITPAPLTITATTNTRVYNGATGAAAIPTVSGLKSGDTVTGLAEVYGDRNAGTGKTLTVSAFTVNDANGGNNYTVTTVANTTGVITPAPITVTATTNSRTYDGTTGAAALPTITTGALVSGNTVVLAETYSDRNAGANKTLTPTATITDGNAGNNYAVTLVTNTTGVINKALLTITATTNTKTYDGTTGAAALPTVTGTQTGDTVTGLAEVYADKNAGTGKTLTSSAFTVNDGNGGNHYTVGTAANTTGTINVRVLTVTATTNTKTYDGTTGAAALPTITSGTLAPGDTAVLAETYAGKDAGTGKTLTPTATISDGNGGLNYAVTLANDVTGVINQKTVNILATRAFEGTTTFAGGASQFTP